MVRITRFYVIWTMLLVLVGCQRGLAPVPLNVYQQPGAEANATSTVPGQAETTAQSRLRIDTWEFGVVPPGTELRHRYTIKNSGAATWTMKQITPSCSCTYGEFTARTIKPGEATSVEV